MTLASRGVRCWIQWLRRRRSVGAAGLVTGRLRGRRAGGPEAGPGDDGAEGKRQVVGVGDADSVRARVFLTVRGLPGVARCRVGEVASWERTDVPCGLTVDLLEVGLGDGD